MTCRQLICLVLVLVCAGIPAFCAAERPGGDGIDTAHPRSDPGLLGAESPPWSPDLTGSLVAPLPAWSLCFGGTSNDWGRAVVPISGGGMITAGFTVGMEGAGFHGGSDGYVAKVLPSGSTEWMRCVGGSDGDTILALGRTSDEGVIVGGVTGSSDGDMVGTGADPLYGDAFIARMNTTGAILWVRCFGGERSECANSVSPTSDSGYVIAGETQGYTASTETGHHAGMDAFVTRMTAAREILFTRYIGGSKNEWGRSLLQLPDGGYLIAGWTQSDDGDMTGAGFHGELDAFVSRLNPDGSIVWMRCIGGNSTDAAYSIQPTLDGAYLLAGTTSSLNGDMAGVASHGGPDAFVTKITVDGAILWTRRIGGTGTDEGMALSPTSDGGFVIAGSTSSKDGDMQYAGHRPFHVFDAYVSRLDANGVVLWTRCVGGSSQDDGNAVTQLSDGSYALAGSTSSNNYDMASAGNHGSFDGYVTKLPGIGLSVVSPNGGEIWYQGSTENIRWTYAGDSGSAVKIELLDGESVRAVITPGTSIGSGGSGSFNVTLPSNAPLDTNYRIRITSTSNPSITDTSNAPFGISASSITVVSPNGGETWEQDSTHPLTWNYAGTPGSLVKIEALRSGSVLATIASGHPIGSGGSGSYSLTFPSYTPLGSDYQIRVTSTTYPSFSDTSDAFFTIVPDSSSSITVVSPNGGENWTQGTTQTLRWNYTGNPGSTVRIEALRGETVLATVTSGYPIGSGDSGSYDLKFPYNTPPGSDYRIKITSTSNPGYTDTSDSMFTIVPAIMVVSPNGGENYALNSLLSMNWTYTGNPGPTVMIEVFKGAALLKTLTGIPIGPAGSGSLQVTIPNTTPVGPDYTIRVTSTSYPACRDTSDARFSIGAMAATFQGTLVAYQSLSGGGYFIVNITTVLDDAGGILHPGDQVTIRYASGLPPEYQQDYEIDPDLEAGDTVEVFCTIFGADLVLRDGNYVKGVV
ncbi:MAG TPA: Ser-Thr-rich GPI-anchored membrane family protein [Methanoregulaceae archaeon]|nr:Ser-Thr-rich GPI-anchored membrane family protein [Methanoregulaceae archaeon]